MLRTNVQKILILAFVFFMPVDLFADVNLTALSISGMSAIRFGRVDLQKANDQEVTLRITSSKRNPGDACAPQYQVFQRLSGPLTNEQGMSLNTSALLTGGQTGSNAFGSFYLMGLDNLGYSDQLVYASDTCGHSDSFRVIYRADPSAIRESGNFTGNVVYTVRPMDGGSQAQVVMRVFMESIGNIDVKTKSSSGIDSVSLRTEGAGMQSGYFSINYKNNYGDKINIYQELLEPLRNDTAETLDAEVIHFFTAGDCRELRFQNASPLERKRELICADTDADGTATINFQVSEQAQSLRAGIYSGRVRYVIESSQGEKNYEINLNLEIMPVFKMEVEYPSGGVNFNRLLPTDPPQLREVLVKIKTNLGRPYNVTQMVGGELTNEKGQALAKDYFTFRQEMASGSNGRVFAPDFVPVPLKDAPLFYSDPKGSPAQFKVIYRLRPAEAMAPGNYNTAITYSLGEI